MSEQKPTPTPPAGRVRAAAVAGLFYPKNRQELSRMLDDLLAAAKPPSLTNLRALICPHAGYEYSGPVAATAYKTIAGGRFDMVIILAASHYADFRGVCVPATDAYETPLGRVPVSDKAKVLAKQSPFVVEPKCFVQRPGWFADASRPAPPAGEDTPETWEHSVEVQVPFLQKVLKDFTILPVVFGTGDPETVARALADLVNDQTLVVASTDLSHYRPYAEARVMDQRTLKWICDLDVKAFQTREAQEAACGRMAVLTLMHLAKLKGWSPHLLDYRNSGDTSGDKSRGVVGYAAVAFTGPAKTAASANPAGVTKSASYSPDERKFLLELARKTLENVTAGKGLPIPPADRVPGRLKEPKGCFVTLTQNGQLRGCIGNILPAGPLYQAVMENTESAALRDLRFPPVTASEVDKIRIEISVLTEPQPLEFKSPEELLAKLHPHTDGVVLKIGGRGATFLPQVWEQLPDKVEFLNHLAMKAGCAPADWRGRDVTVSIYHVAAFAEGD